MITIVDPIAYMSHHPHDCHFPWNEIHPILLNTVANIMFMLNNVQLKHHKISTQVTGHCSQNQLDH